MNIATSPPLPIESAALDSAHVGDIKGALGTIAEGSRPGGTNFATKLKTLFAVLGPGLIVMVGDNDAGAFGTYTQAGQNYGTSLLWTLMLLIPVLYVNQEMVLRLGAVSGVGHAKLIFARFGKFWGAFSVIDLFILNALTIVTEFIGISLALGFLGLDKTWGVMVAAVVVMGAASTGDFRRFERFALALVAGSLLLDPVVLLVHPPMSQIAHDFLVPGMPAKSKLTDVMLLVIGIVGTTVAPWQLFFQQSYVIDKRITPRFIAYERWDLVFGIVLVIVGGVAMIAFCAATFAGRPEFGGFVDAGAVATGLAKYAGEIPATLFVLALLDACIIGAAAVSLSTAYALGDTLQVNHSLHRKPTEAKEFYLVYFALIAVAAALVLIPGTPLGLLTNAVQTLAGILLPSATVFLLLLCNDKAVLGPWVNGRWLNLFTGAVVAVLVMLSVILTAAVMFPDLSEKAIFRILGGGSVLAIVVTTGAKLFGNKSSIETPSPADYANRMDWRMPPITALAPARLTALEKIWMIVLRGYLVIAGGLVLIRIIKLAMSRG